MTKKLNKFEIKSLARTIINEAKEAIATYNESVKKSKAYLDEIERIKKANPLNELREKFRKEAILLLGTKPGKDLYIKVGRGYDDHDEKELMAIKELNNRMLKNEHIQISLEKLEDELILAQVSSKSLNTIKALKVAELTK